MASINELMGQLGGIIPKTNRVDANQYLNSNIEKYVDQPEIANKFKSLASLKNSALDNARNNIVNAYSVFEESTNPAFRQYIQTSLQGGEKMLSDIDNQMAGVNKFYGPGGEAESMIDDYIVKYGNLITQQAGNNQSLAKNTGIRAGASQAAVRAGVAQQQALDAENIIKFQEKKVADLSNLYQTYNTLITQLRQQAAGVNQQFVLQPLAQALDRQTQIAQALVQNEASLNQIKLSMGAGGGSKISTRYSELLKKLNNGTITAAEKVEMNNLIAEAKKTEPKGQSLDNDVNNIIESINGGSGSNIMTTIPLNYSGYVK